MTVAEGAAGAAETKTVDEVVARLENPSQADIGPFKDSLRLFRDIQACDDPLLKEALKISMQVTRVLGCCSDLGRLCQAFWWTAVSYPTETVNRWPPPDFLRTSKVSHSPILTVSLLSHSLSTDIVRECIIVRHGLQMTQKTSAATPFNQSHPEYRACMCVCV